MNSKKFLTLTGVVFFAVAVLHFIRIIYGVGVTVGSSEVPEAYSYIIVLAAAYLAYKSWRLISK
jgi:threonine/homoserine/homoserine lactone efflux protein